MVAIKTHYDNLQVMRNASPEVIRAAYKGLTQRYHPDRHPEDRARYERVMMIINEAFEVLSDPSKRAEHDAWITRQEVALRAAPAAETNPAREPNPRGERSLAGTPPLNEPPTANYADAARVFRQSRVVPEAPESARSEPRSAPASESPQPRPTGEASTKAFHRKHHSNELEMRAKSGRLVTWQDWLTGILAMGCILVAWPTWDVAGPIALIVGLGLLGVLVVRGLKQQAAIDASRDGSDAKVRLATDEKTRPMSAWTGLGIAAAIVIAIMAAIPLSNSRAGRVAIVIGGGVLVLLGIRQIVQRVVEARDAGASPSEASGAAWWLTAIVWGWLAYAITPHRLGTLTWVDYVTIGIVLLAAWIPAYGACRALLTRGMKGNLSWTRIGGYIFPIALAMVVSMMLRGSGGAASFLRTAQLANASGSAFGLLLAHNVGAFVGALISAALVTAVLVGVGALVSAVIAGAYAVVNVPRARARLVVLLASWAAIPTFGVVVFLVKWVP